MEEEEQRHPTHHPARGVCTGGGGGAARSGVRSVTQSCRMRGFSVSNAFKLHLI